MNMTDSNNRSEGYNINLSVIMGKHPNLHTFISILKVVYHEMNVELDEMMGRVGEGITDF